MVIAIILIVVIVCFFVAPPFYYMYVPKIKCEFRDGIQKIFFTQHLINLDLSYADALHDSGVSKQVADEIIARRKLIKSEILYRKFKIPYEI